MSCEVLVLGIGNLLWADEGFGVRCVEALDQRFQFGPQVRLLDGGTQGLYLVNDLAACRRLLIFDAIDYGLSPGTVKVVRGDEVPCFTGAKKMSLHQTGFQDVLSAAQLLGWSPQQLTLLGVQAQELEDYGGGLTPLLSGKVDEVVALAVEELRTWGFPPEARTAPAPSMLGLLDRQTYEGGRPSAAEACRIGDDRVLASLGAA